MQPHSAIADKRILSLGSSPQKIRVTRQSTVFIAKHAAVTSILLCRPQGRTSDSTSAGGTARTTDLIGVYDAVGKVIGLASAASIGKTGVTLVFANRSEIRAHWD